ncbi:tRNA-specific 2-thiouridylase MnmA [Spiroplasma sabaudiense Ar-1343]|uniref:tRNA-specific 2-thiouridylase MnmA n=1 Tax=Spiroplasma sabaudiense Ar-1343 TaxID=1276257 RepID=W6AA50_9MOLU|nr:tRNA 2-thiouridine(34) synthase MnmA [Spiroplasma sabaudiense]AHI53705.1 tRNA-specific 2-thiouridylase MnmA [Spiroplasma sabaudiense Ar-1343]
MEKLKKIIVGLSGGVDSSVAALLLKQQGFEVEGLFMRNWDSDLNQEFLGRSENKDNICEQEKDYNDALEVANKLNIKLHRIDFVKEYWDYVFEYFISEYKKGRTPNPDILCNKYIKFDKFSNYAFNQLGADFIAMGHYAGTEFNKESKQFNLLVPKDKNKDQTYFLSQLNQKQISKAIFPLFNLDKNEVRKIAKEHGLITADKKDSTGICFIGERDFTKFLQNYIPNQPGNIVDIKTNKVIGSHIGAMYYTIGQRKGLNLGGFEEPYYVAKKDIEKKIIYVAKLSDETFLISKKCLVNEINWNTELKFIFEDPTDFVCEAKFRYRQKGSKVRVKKITNDSIIVEYLEPIKSVTEGQQAVFYLNNICIGGGTVDKVFK